MFAATIAAALLAFRGETRAADDLLRYRLPLVEGESIEAGIAFLEGRVTELQRASMLIARAGRDFCGPAPRCEQCPLRELLPPGGPYEPAD